MRVAFPLFALLIALACPAQALAPDVDPGLPGPGGWTWMPELAPAGPVLVVVVIAEQRAYAYRNGVRVGVSSASTGRPGFETPPGVYSILQKRREHYSNLYDDAPMPYMQRLSWDGIALHAGQVPGYPASHGCVRLPEPFARLLFEATRPGTTVVVSPDAATVPRLGVQAPLVSAPDGNGIDLPWRWTPQRASDGPLSAVVSLADRTVLVLRNGVEIGRSAIGLDASTWAGTRAFVVLEGPSPRGSNLVPDRPGRRWLEAGVSDPSGFGNASLPWIEVPPEFADAVYEALVPGSAVVVTDRSLSAGDAGLGMVILVSAADEDLGVGGREALPPAPDDPDHG